MPVRHARQQIKRTRTLRDQQRFNHSGPLFFSYHARNHPARTDLQPSATLTSLLVSDLPCTRCGKLNFFSRRTLNYFLRALSSPECVRIATTTDRRFRHRQPKILRFLYEFFLTTFPHAPILRFQARGTVAWLLRFLRSQRPQSRTEV